MRAELNRAICLLCPHSQNNHPGFKGGACACMIDPARRDIVERAKAGDCELFTEEGRKAAAERSPVAPTSPCQTCGQKIISGAIGLAKVAAQAMGIPIDQAPRKLQAARLRVCTPCDQNAGGICADCKCVIAAKVRVASEDCPRKLWPKGNERQFILPTGNH